MDRRLIRVGTAVLALGLAAAGTMCRRADGGHDGGGTGATVCDTPCNQILIVGNDGALSCPDATISLGATHEVAWRTSGFSGTLQITFDAPSPFPSLRCQGGMCFSGPPDPNALPPGAQSKTFGYTSNLTVDESKSAEQSGSGGQTGAVTPTPTPVRARSALGHIIIKR
jgi:hypothetical protein